jgi:two-component system, chemotaxis family, sensor kinase CheA
MGVGDDGRRERRIAMFRQVAAERIAKLNLAWIEIERRAAEPDAFLREAHTLKGEASLTGFVAVSHLLHAVEDYVKLVHDRGGPPVGGDGDTILSGLDLALRLAMGSPEAASKDVDDFLAQVATARGSPPPARPLPSPNPPSQEGETSGIPQGRVAETEERSGSTNGPARPERSIRVTADKIDHVRTMVSDLLLAHVRWRQLARTARRMRETAEGARPAVGPGDALPSLDAWSSVVVGLSDLESRLRDETHDLERLVADLDTTTRDLRMIPLANLLDRFPVPLRQLSRQLGRQVRFVTSGEQIEVDKALLEMLEEPLLHLLRNAVDHGVEPAAVRAAAGKPAEGVVRVAAGLVGQRLHLRVSDDGGGIDVEVVRQRAIASGLLDAAVAASMGDREILRTIFAAGFSTRERVSEVSGRGIGLNVVLDLVENVGGKVEVHTDPGHGTAFDIEIPLSVAITRVVLFRVGMSSYALPAASVRSLVEARNLTRSEGADGPTVEYAGTHVPLLDLCEVLDEPEAVAENPRIVIAQSGTDWVALAGTEGHLEREVMLKPLGKFFEKLPLVPAAVQLEEGAIALVLKAAELVLLARTRGRTDLRQDGVAGRRPAPCIALVADDSPLVRDIVAQALRAHGMRVLVASDGEEALAVFEAHTRVDVVVTDIDMPRLDGLSLIRALRKQEVSRDIPVVVISMRGGEPERRAALEAGVSAYIDKGDFTQALLWQTIRPLVGP